jgi:transposase
MAQPTHYVPAISRPVVAALFHEAKRRRLPMTRLADRLLRECLQGTPGWETAARDWPELTAQPRQDRPSR